MPTFSQRHVLLLASYIIIFGGLLLVLPLKLLPSLLAGLLVFELVNMLTPQLQRLIEGRRARWLAVALLGTLIVSALALIFAGVAALPAITAAAVACWTILRLARARIGGVTGDILGAVQQMAEIATLCCFAALF